MYITNIIGQHINLYLKSSKNECFVLFTSRTNDSDAIKNPLFKSLDFFREMFLVWFKQTIFFFKFRVCVCYVIASVTKI